MEKIIDCHCDLTAYLADLDAQKHHEIRCSAGNLLAANVGLQIMAFYSSSEKGSVQQVENQIKEYKKLLQIAEIYEFEPSLPHLKQGLGIMAAIENASGLCEENEDISVLENNFYKFTKEVQLMYITLTHHLENRFGGGNYTGTGLKADGKRLLELLSGRKIAADLSHTSDQLACDILNFIDKENLEIPVLASHSNFRAVFNHPRNLPDELAKEIIRRKGLIGINFVKYFINPDNFEHIYFHLEHGIRLGAEDHLCFGADFFDDKSHPDQDKFPFFFDDLGDPSAYQKINNKADEIFNPQFRRKLSSQNVLNYFQRVYQT